MTGLDTRIECLAIDKSKPFQTICQINKYPNTISPNTISSNQVYGIYMHMGYTTNRSVCQYLLNPRLFRRISHSETGDIGAGYIRDTKQSLLVYIKHYMPDMNVWAKEMFG